MQHINANYDIQGISSTSSILRIKETNNMPTLSKNISKARLSYKLLLECLYLRMSGPGRNRHFQQFPRKMVVTNFLFLTIQDQVYMRKCWGYIR